MRPSGWRWLEAIEHPSSYLKQHILDYYLPGPGPSRAEDWVKYREKALSSLLTTEQGLKDAAEDWLVEQLNSALGDISPRLETGAIFPRLLLRHRKDLKDLVTKREVKWRPTYWFSSLAGALWLQLFLTIVQGNLVRECLGCGRLFEVTGRRDQVYCDHLCRGAANAKSYYQREKRRRRQ